MKKAKLLLGKKIARVLLFVILDIFCMAASSFLAVWIVYNAGKIPEEKTDQILLSLPFNIVIMLIVYGLTGLYAAAWKYLSQAETFNIILATASVSLFSFAAQTMNGVKYPKGFYLIQGIFMAAFVFISRITIKGLYINSERKRTMIVGLNEQARMIIDEINTHINEYRSEIICIVDDKKTSVGTFLNGIEVKGTTKDIEKLIKRHHIKKVIIADIDAPKARIDRIIEACKAAKCEIETIPKAKFTEEQILDIADLEEAKKKLDPKRDPRYYILEAHSSKFITNAWAINYNIYTIIKRVIDVVFSFLGLVILSPLIAIVSFLIYKEDGQPVIFKQLRTGHLGKKFYIYKFRTMSVNNDVRDNSLPDQYTKIGKVIRKLSIDEIPQLINILKGDMSFIGPRPWIPEYYNLMTKAERKRTLVRPGLTGLAQCMGRNDLSIFTKIGYDLLYVKHYSILMDIRVVIKTIKIVIKKTAADAGKNTIHNELSSLRKDRVVR